MACLSLVFLAGIFIAIPPTGNAEALKIGGTGGAMGAIKQLAEAFRKSHPDSDFRFVPRMGSGGAIKAVLAGDLDIGISARSLTDEERKRGAKQFDYARTPFAVVVHGNSAALGFTLEELADIYADRRKSWPDGTPIRLVLRPQSDTDIDMLKRMSPGMKQAVENALSRKGMIIALTDGENADKLEKIPGALGTATLSQVLSENRFLKPLPLDGRPPAPNRRANPSYPYFKTFSIVVRSDPSVPAMEFVDFVLSGAARDLLIRTGHVTLTGRGR